MSILNNVLNNVQEYVVNLTGVRLLPDRLLHPRGTNVETLPIPGYCQTQTYTCGFVAGLMILRYFRPDYPAERLYGIVRPDPRWGTSRRRLKMALEVSGLRVSQRRNLDFKGICAAIDHRKPIAVVVDVDEQTSHWVVVYGYGRKPNRVYVAANGLPLLSRKEYPWGSFKQYLWSEPGIGLVCSGPKDAPDQARPK